MFRVGKQVIVVVNRYSSTFFNYMTFNFTVVHPNFHRKSSKKDEQYKCSVKMQAVYIPEPL